MMYQFLIAKRALKLSVCLSATNM